MKVYPLFEGSYSVDNSKKFLPFDPAVHRRQDRPASLFIFVQPFLVETSTQLILIDTGLGFNTPAGEPVLHENIRKTGHDPQDVDMVLMSHLHFDHAAGMIRHNDTSTALSFPLAEYVINRQEWEYAYSHPSASYRAEVYDVVQRSGNLRFIEGDGRLNDSISYQVTGGHCKYHQVFKISEGDETIFYGGDVLPEPEQVMRRFKAKYDYDGERSMQLREEFGKQAAHENWLCLFYHAKSHSMGRIKEENASFTFLPQD